jgi:AraC-like DNA-binding protein
MAYIGSGRTLQSLADVVGMSTRNLARHFVSETGITPHEFVERTRIDAARTLLRVATGLSNPSPMTAASARQTGCASCSASVWVSHRPLSRKLSKIRTTRQRLN